MKQALVASLLPLRRGLLEADADEDSEEDVPLRSRMRPYRCGEWSDCGRLPQLSQTVVLTFPSLAREARAALGPNARVVRFLERVAKMETANCGIDRRERGSDGTTRHVVNAGALAFDTHTRLASTRQHLRDCGNQQPDIDHFERERERDPSTLPPASVTQLRSRLCDGALVAFRAKFGLRRGRAGEPATLHRKRRSNPLCNRGLRAR